MRPATWAYAEEFVTETDVLDRARERAAKLRCGAVSAGAGAALRVLAASANARAIVEVGTGAGVSGLCLLGGMPSDGVLTTIDINPEHQRAARQAFSEAGIAAQRTRIITGDALQVMSRLADGGYDLVLVDGHAQDYPDHVTHARRLLRRGGVLVVTNMLWHDRVADPAVRDETTVLLRDLGKQLRDDPELVTTLLPVGDGLLTAVRR